MTLLEFVADQLIGPPAYRGPDYSMYRCPFHHDTRPSFSVRPPHPDYPTKFKCWSCQRLGDEYDLLKHFRPELDYDGCRELLEKWRAEFNARGPAGSALLASLPSGTGSQALRASAGSRRLGCRVGGSRYNSTNYAFEPPTEAAADEVGRPTSPLDEEGISRLAEAARVLRVCAAARVPPAVLAANLEVQIWFLKTEREHVEVCADPEHCDDRVCRAARGLRPLTDDEVRAGSYRVDGHKKKKPRSRRSNHARPPAGRP
jgi:hypothetical protein